MKVSNCQTKSKKIVSITLVYIDLDKAQQLQNTLSYPAYVEEIKEQAQKTFNVDSIYWELILNVIATKKQVYHNNGDIMLKPVKPDCWFIIKYSNGAEDKVLVWRYGLGAIADYYYRIDDKYRDAFFQMLNSYIEKIKNE